MTRRTIASIPATLFHFLGYGILLGWLGYAYLSHQQELMRIRTLQATPIVEKTLSREIEALQSDLFDQKEKLEQEIRERKQEVLLLQAQLSGGRGGTRVIKSGNSLMDVIREDQQKKPISNH